MKALFSKHVLMLILMLVSVAAIKGEDWSSVRRALEEMNSKYEKAMVLDDVNSMISYYADDAISYPDYEPGIMGKDNIRMQMEKEIAAGFKYHSMDLTLIDLKGSGDMAIESGRWKAIYSLPGHSEKIPGEGKYLTIWQKQKDGNWKITHEMWNTNSFPHMEITAEGKKTR